MMFLRLLNVQGIAGIAVAVCLGLLLVIQKGDTRHWRKQSDQYERLYRGEQAAFAGTVANYRAAAEAARAADLAASERVAAEQRDINQRSQNALETRLAFARTAALRLRGEPAAAQADPRGRSGPLVPGLSAAPSGAAQAAGQDGFPVSDALTATEQAIQLDELIGWVRRQAAVDPNAAPQRSH
jgi:hypothetical protein